MTGEKVHSGLLEITTVPLGVEDERFWQILSLSVGNPTPMKMNAIRHAYRAEEGRGLLAAKAGDELVGCLGFRTGADTVEVTNIAVLPSHERRGIGRALIEAVAVRFPDWPIEAETDGEAVGFYESLCFKASPCHRRPEFPNRWTCRRVP